MKVSTYFALLAEFGTAHIPIIFNLTQAFTMTAAEVEQKLAQYPFGHCTAQQESSIGFVAPLYVNDKSPLVHDAANGYLLLCIQKETKVLPAATVNEHVAERVKEIEDREARKLAKKARSAIKDEVLLELLPKALTVSKKTYAYIDPKNGWLIVDSASAKNVEELVSLLRKCFGSLPVVLPNTKEKPADAMSDWLQYRYISNFKICDECELYSFEEGCRKAKFKQFDVTLPEIKAHLKQGMLVKSLVLSFADRMSFVIGQELVCKAPEILGYGSGTSRRRRLMECKPLGLGYRV